MKLVLHHFIKLRTSIAQRIQNSKLFAERFRANIIKVDSELGRSGRTKDLRAAKHRHESLSKPLGRCVLHIKALLLTAEQICNERRGRPEGQEAKHFFHQYVNEENLVLLSLMADAADENLSIIRFTDSEAMDSSTFESECFNFVSKIQVPIDSNGHPCGFSRVPVVLGLLRQS